MAASNSSKGKKKVRFRLAVIGRSDKLAPTLHDAPVAAEPCHPCMPQKWSKGKMKEKVNNQVLFDPVSLGCPLPLPSPPQPALVAGSRRDALNRQRCTKHRQLLRLIASFALRHPIR